MSDQANLQIFGRDARVHYAVYLSPHGMECFYCQKLGKRVEVQIHNIFERSRLASVGEPLFSLTKRILEEALLHGKGRCVQGACQRAYDRERLTRIDKVIRQIEANEDPKKIFTKNPPPRIGTNPPAYRAPVYPLKDARRNKKKGRGQGTRLSLVHSRSGNHPRRS